MHMDRLGASSSLVWVISYCLIFVLLYQLVILLFCCSFTSIGIGGLVNEFRKSCSLCKAVLFFVFFCPSLHLHYVNNTVQFFSFRRRQSQVIAKRHMSLKDKLTPLAILSIFQQGLSSS